VDLKDSFFQNKQEKFSRPLGGRNSNRTEKIGKKEIGTAKVVVSQ